MCSVMTLIEGTDRHGDEYSTFSLQSESILLMLSLAMYVFMYAWYLLTIVILLQESLSYFSYYTDI